MSVIHKIMNDVRELRVLAKQVFDEADPEKKGFIEENQLENLLIKIFEELGDKAKLKCKEVVVFKPLKLDLSNTVNLKEFYSLITDVVFGLIEEEETLNKFFEDI